MDSLNLASIKRFICTAINQLTDVLKPTGRKLSELIVIEEFPCNKNVCDINLSCTAERKCYDLEIT